MSLKSSPRFGGNGRCASKRPGQLTFLKFNNAGVAARNCPTSLHDIPPKADIGDIHLFLDAVPNEPTTVSTQAAALALRLVIEDKIIDPPRWMRRIADPQRDAA